MTQPWAHGQAELESYLKISRADGTVEYYHVLDGVNVPITAAQYAAATQEG